jgi:molybdopterin/thiamine biosynthesis adenylyltransferase/ubiquitin-protein ligase
MTAMQRWYERDPERLRTELRAGERTGAHLRWVPRASGLVGWEGQVEVQGKQHFLRITYPPSFPMAAPHVVETEPFKDAIVDDSKTYHQLVDGSLCLYTVGNDGRSWSPAYTVADVLERHREYREMANAGAHVDEHGARMDVAGVPAPMTLVMSPGQAQAMNMPHGRGRLDIAMSVLGFGVVERLTGRDMDIRVALTPWTQGGVFPIPILRGYWARVACSSWRRLRTQADLEGLLSATLPAPQLEQALAADVLVLARDDAGEPGNALAVFILRRFHESKPVDWNLSSQVQIVDLDQRVFARVDGAITGRKRLADARVAVVGLGSLGSAVAVHLARSGVAELHLFDPERLEPENVVRHAGDLSGLYQTKVSVIEALIRRRNPHARVHAYASSPLWDGWGQAPARFQELLDHPASLVVVTTADDQVERAINQMAVLAGTPVVYGSVLGAAEHGRIFRVIPGQTACYQCILDAQAAEPGRYPALQEARGAEHAGVHPYRQPGIPGLGIDVEQVALMTARLALQTLALRLEVDIGYPPAHGDHFLWTSRGGWSFDYPQQVRVESYGQRAACPVCGSDSRLGADHGSLPAELKDLVQRLSDPGRMAPGSPALGSAPAIPGPGR